jgi:type VI protein secretion system component VasA
VLGVYKVQYEDLHRRYGSTIAQRVRRELKDAEFNQIDIDDLALWLEARAEIAHENYRQLLNNPLTIIETNSTQAGEACRLWREAEDLAYLVAIAEDTSLDVKAG